MLASNGAKIQVFNKRFQPAGIGGVALLLMHNGIKNFMESQSKIPKIMCYANPLLMLNFLIYFLN